MSEFKVGDKVRVKDDEDSIKSMLAFSIPLKDIEAMKGEVLEVLAVSSTVAGAAYLKSPRSGNHWWFGPEHVTAEVEPHVFKIGDRVKVVSTEERLKEIGVGSKEFRRRLLAGEAAEVVHERKQGEGHKEGGILRLSLPDAGDHWEVYVNMVELAGDEVEPDWDPMTEPIHMGDLVEVVFDNEHKGKQGRVTRCDNPESGRWGVTQDNGKSAGDSWSRRGSLKLIEKADGTVPEPKPKKAEKPKFPFSVGDRVKILHTTKEFQAMGWGVVDAARLAGRTGRVTDITPGSTPEVHVAADNGGHIWCQKERLEKLSA